MASNFPSSLDSFTNPSSTDALDSVSVPHASQHSDLNDAVEALEAKVGADGSAVTSSHDYKIAQLEGRDTAGLVHISRTTIGTAVSSVTVSGAFSTDYDNYLIVYSGITLSSTGRIRLTIDGSTGSTYRYGSARFADIVSVNAEGSASSAFWHIGLANTGVISGHVQIMNPNKATQTQISAASGGQGYSYFSGGTDTNTAASTDFTFTPAVGTFTGGTIDVYGYAKA